MTTTFGGRTHSFVAYKVTLNLSNFVLLCVNLGGLCD